MLDKKVVELLNQQITKEFYSAYLYLDFSNFYYNQGLDGFGNWYKIQAQEELDHAMLIIQYMQNNGEAVVLETIEKPGIALTSAKDVVLCQEKVQVKCAQFPRSCRPGQPARAATDSAIVVRYSASY